jgi:hypothetical protein
MQTRKRAEKWLRDLKLWFSRYLGNKLLVSIDQLSRQESAKQSKAAEAHSIEPSRQ